jgi:carbamoylphosphate synthase small subunit
LFHPGICILSDSQLGKQGEHSGCEAAHRGRVFAAGITSKNLNFVIPKEKLFAQNGLSFNVTTNADKTLDSFCHWQRKVNSPEQDHPDHHDVAILLTR